MPISGLGMWVTMANTGAPLRSQSYNPFRRCRLPGPDDPSTAAGRPVVMASAPAANAPASSLRTWMKVKLAVGSTDRVDDRIGRVADHAVDVLDTGLDHDRRPGARQRSLPSDLHHRNAELSHLAGGCTRLSCRQHVGRLPLVWLGLARRLKTRAGAPGVSPPLDGALQLVHELLSFTPNVIG